MKLILTKSFTEILFTIGYNWEVQVADYLMTKTSKCIQVVRFYRTGKSITFPRHLDLYVAE